MSERLPITQSPGARAVDTTLVALGFVRGADGTLAAPAGSSVTFVPIGAFFELRIILADGSIATAVLAKAALKVVRAGAKL
jgi:hypothetical protein